VTWRPNRSGFLLRCGPDSETDHVSRSNTLPAPRAAWLEKRQALDLRLGKLRRGAQTRLHSWAEAFRSPPDPGIRAGILTANEQQRKDRQGQQTSGHQQPSCAAAPLLGWGLSLVSGLLGELWRVSVRVGRSSCSPVSRPPHVSRPSGSQGHSWVDREILPKLRNERNPPLAAGRPRASWPGGDHIGGEISQGRRAQTPGVCLRLN